MARTLKTIAALLVALLPALAASPVAGAAVSPWHLVWSTNFTQDAPLGSFSGCTGFTRTICTGLPTALRSQWWAYPDGWRDTATKRGLPVHGYYEPSDTVSIAGGVMKIRMWRPADGGPVHSAAVLPKAALHRTYGRYVETFRVLNPDPGYIAAHMLHTHGTKTDGSAYEIDYPNGPGFGEKILAFVHFPTHRPWFAAGANFNSTWHTSRMDWTANGITFYMDGRQIGHLSGRVSDMRMNWVLQNETNVLPGKPVPAPGSSTTMQIRYAAYYAWS